MGHRHDLDYSRYSLLHKILGGLAAAGKGIPLKWIMAMQKRRLLKTERAGGHGGITVITSRITSM